MYLHSVGSCEDRQPDGFATGRGSLVLKDVNGESRRLLHGQIAMVKNANLKLTRSAVENPAVGLARRYRGHGHDQAARQPVVRETVAETVNQYRAHRIDVEVARVTMVATTARWHRRSRPQAQNAAAAPRSTMLSDDFGRRRDERAKSSVYLVMSSCQDGLWQLEDCQELIWWSGSIDEDARMPPRLGCPLCGAHGAQLQS